MELVYKVRPSDKNESSKFSWVKGNVILRSKENNQGDS
jgi:hypothetical protein